MEISTKAKERFCKDCNIPIRLYQEPYFYERLVLYDEYYGTLEKWNLFVNELRKYHCEQDYFEDYNRVKDSAINSIKNSVAYNRFINCDMSTFTIEETGITSKDIFHPDNDGRTFCSIDMRKANFSSLYTYDPEIFSGASTWEEFLGRFTTNKHIINSKYIRQVIMGNCNPKRHITYEKYLMYNVLQTINRFFDTKNYVVSFSNDEIVLDITECNMSFFFRLQEYLNESISIPLKVKIFKLKKIKGCGYVEKIYNEDGSKDIDFKCLNNYMLPIVIRKLKQEPVTENDLVFFNEGYLSKFIETPEIGDVE